MKNLFSVRTFLVAVLLMAATGLTTAQQSVLSELFGGTELPANWTTETTSWSMNDGYVRYSSNVVDDSSKLISPVLDAASLTNEPRLKFSFKQPAVSGGACDSLVVLYRLATDAEWQKLKSYTAAVEDFMEQEIVLPETSATFQVAFEGYNNAAKGVWLQYVAIENKAECTATPTNFVQSSVLTTAADLSWDAIATDSLQGYNLKVATAPITDFTLRADVYDDFLTDEYYKLSNLTSNTTYYAYVQYDCGSSDQSAWAELVFATACEKVSLPYATDFEGDDFGCFTFYTTMSDPTNCALSSVYKYDGERAVKMYTTAKNYAYVVLPELDAESLSDLQVTFCAATNNTSVSYTRTIEVGVAESADMNTYVPIKSLSLPSTRTWEKITVSLASYTGRGRRIVFKTGSADYTNNIYIDNVEIKTAEACPMPMFVNVSNIKSSSAWITWEDAGTVTEWNMAVLTKQVDDVEAVDPADPAVKFMGAVTEKPYQLTDLAAGTTYYVYLSSSCDMAEWTAAKSFKTTQSVAIPYVEHFDRYDLDMYDVWTGVPTDWVAGARNASDADVTSSSYYGALSTAANYELTAYTKGSLYLKGTSAITAYAMMPEMPESDLSKLMVTFRLSSPCTSGVVVGVCEQQTNDLPTGKMFTEATNFMPIDTVYPTAINTWEQFRVPLTDFTGAGGFITFRTLPAGSCTNTAYIDDVEVDYIPDCSAVNNLEVTADNTETLTATWTPVTAETSWRIKISTTEISDFTADADVYDGTVTTCTYTQTGLSMGTTYYVYVQPTCDGAEWKSASITTGVVITLPYYNDFTSEVTGSGKGAPQHWIVGNNAGTTSASYIPYVNATAWAAATGYSIPSEVVKNSLYFYNTTTANTKQPYAIMPELSGVDVKDVTISFWGFANTTTASYGKSISIGVMTDPNDYNTLTPVDTLTLSAGKVPEYFIVPMSDYTGTGKYIVFYVNATTTNYFAIDNLSITLSSNPQRVTNVTVSDVTTTSAKLQWKENGTSTRWNVKVFDTNVAIDQVDETPALKTLVQNSTAEMMLTNLDPATKYYVYVQSVSGTQTGMWSPVTSFLTECPATFAIPYYNDLNSYDVGSTSNNTMTCFSVEGSTTNPYIKAATTLSTAYYDDHTYGKDGTKRIFYMTAASGKVAQLILPKFDKPLNTLQLTFYGISDLTSYVGYVQIGVMESGVFQQVADFRLQESKTWEECIVDFSSYTGSGDSIAIRMDYAYFQNTINNGTGKTLYMYIDDISVIEIPQCKKVQEIAFSKIDSVSAHIAWTPAGDETAWNVKVSSIELTDMAQTADVYDGQVAVNALDVSDLSGGTDYYVYVQSVNDAKACVGEWSNAAAFTTWCTAMPLPYNNLFEGLATNAVPECVFVSGANTTTSFYNPLNVNITGCNGDGRLYIYAAKDQNNYMAFPTLGFDSVKDVQMTMYLYKTASNKQYFEVGVMTDPTDPSTFMAVAKDSLLESKVWLPYYFTFDNYVGDDDGNFGKYIALHPLNSISSTGTESSAGLYLDDVTIDWKQECVSPVMFTVDSVGRDSVGLSWRACGSASQWRVRLYTTQPADVETTAPYRELTVDTVAVLFRNIAPNTKYYAYVQSLCANDAASGWDLSTSFKTDCADTQVLPYVEDFESQTVGQSPTCWDLYGKMIACGSVGGNQTPSANVSASAAYTGANGLYLDRKECPTSSSTFSSPIAVLPTFDVDSIQRLYMAFDARMASGTGTLDIGTISDIDNPETFKLLTTINLTNIWQSCSVDLAEVYKSADQNVRLALRPATNSVYVDNLIVTTDKVSCMAPRALQLATFSHDALAVKWADVSPANEEWIVEYGPKGFALGTGTQMRVATTAATLTGLTEQTAYDIYVKGACADGEWTGPLTASTIRTPVMLPYHTTFDDAADNAQWTFVRENALGVACANQWYIGMLDGDNQLFVSNDGGKNNTYTTKDAEGNLGTSYVWAYRTFAADDTASYQLTLNYKVQGNLDNEHLNDYLKCYVMPAGYTYLATNIRNLLGNTTTGTGANEAVLMSKVYGINDYVTETFVTPTLDAGKYDVVFYWYNAATGTAGTAAAITELTMEQNPCSGVSKVRVTDLTAETAAFTWDAGVSRNFEAIVSTVCNSGNPDLLPEADYIERKQFTGRLYSIQGLQQATTYALYLRTLCDDGPTDWVEYRFTTNCASSALPYVEDFEYYIDGISAAPECWTTSTGVAIAQRFADENKDAMGTLTLPAKGYVILPEFDEPINEMEISFKALALFAKEAVILDLGVVDNTYDMNTFEHISYFTLMNYISSTTSSGGLYLNLYDQFKSFTYKLHKYTGNGKHLAIKGDSKLDVYIDDLSIEHLTGCIAPQNLEVVNITENGADLSWESGNENVWVVAVATELCTAKQLDDASEVVVVRDTVNTYPAHVDGLEQGATYYAYVKAVCGAESASEWIGGVPFMTDCGLHRFPLVEDFSGYNTSTVYTNNCWEQKYGQISSVVDNGVALTNPPYGTSYSYQWYTFLNANWEDGMRLVCNGYVVDYNYRDYRYRWLVSPEYAVEGESVLSFDMCYGYLYSDTTYEVSVPQFAVLVSTDGGNTWKADDAVMYDLTQYDYHMTSETIDLSKYQGENIRVAFYFEALCSKFNYLQLDNVRVSCKQVYEYTDSVCVGTNYADYGFKVPFSELKVGSNKLQRTAVGNDFTCDSTVILMLTVLDNDTVTMNATICDGDVYTAEGLSLTEAGQYIVRLTNSNGCDSLLTINLTVNPITVEAVLDTIDRTELPYTNGLFTIDAEAEPGVYTDSLLTDTAQCQWTTYTVTVQEIVGLSNIFASDFSIYPNPVAHNSSVVLQGDFDAADRDGLQVEVFNCIGVLVQRFEPNAYPVVIDGLNTAGVYTVRITTGKSKTYIGKLIVK
ncbi:MAG: fibronectin type III domain-containing protein [Paludibacteraceae bacterium]